MGVQWNGVWRMEVQWNDVQINGTVSWNSVAILFGRSVLCTALFVVLLRELVEEIAVLTGRWNRLDEVLGVDFPYGYRKSVAFVLMLTRAL
jgi:hypothetical protein